MKNFLIKNKYGFSMVEILLVISIFVLLSAVSLPFYNNLHIDLLIKKTGIDITQSLRLAKVRSESWLNNSAHGVYFSTSTITVYQGDSYALRDSVYDEEFLVTNPLSLSYDIVSRDINFSKGLGSPSATGTIQILNSTTSTIKTITINDLGIIDFD